MMRHKDRRSGFSLVELMFSALILMLFITAVTGVYIMAYRMQTEARSQSKLFQEGSYTMDMIQRGESGLYGLMKGRSGSVAIGVSGDGISFMVDKNIPYTDSTADDTQVSIYYDNGDGSDTTLEDNVIVIDPGGGSPLIEVGRNIESVQFTQSGNIVSIELALAEMIRGRAFRTTITRDVLMRN